MTDEKKCTAYPHIILYSILNLLLFFFSIASLMLLLKDFGEVFRIINIVLAVIIPLSFVCVFIYTTFSGWNGKVTFDSEKAWQKRWGKIYEWRWDDVCDITCRTSRPWFLRAGVRGYDFPPLFKLYCLSHKKVLSFCLNEELNERFTKLCTNESINEKFRTLISECDFYYSFKYDKAEVHTARAENRLAWGMVLYAVLRMAVLLFAFVAIILFYTKKTVAAAVTLGCVILCLIASIIIYFVAERKKRHGDNVNEERRNDGGKEDK